MKRITDPSAWVLPRYGTESVADLLPSVACHLGLPGCKDVLGLPNTEKYIVMLVDGFGWLSFQQFQSQAPFLSKFGELAEPITTTVPSTTAAALTSLGTGLPPSVHGMAGYTFRLDNQIQNALHLPKTYSGEDLQPNLTWFERISDAGMLTYVVNKEEFRGSVLSQAAFRGSILLGTEDEPSMERQLELTLGAAQGEGRALIYLYEPRLDHSGHGHGVGSEQWLEALEHIDQLAQELFENLPDDTSLLITGDHGMVNVSDSGRVVFESEPLLTSNVDLLGGEARFRHIYTSKPAAVKTSWKRMLGSRATVLTREEAFSEGWFGPVGRVQDRFGDVVAAMKEDYAVVSKRQPNEMQLVGMHGSLTATEMLVPLFQGTN
ncbi:MAG: alkaline phosphatase family protein [Propionibacteriaceae bacterium]|jgi:predicted AlkP superfamily pyrophosphatase or phosphodiesterase|nr:alkaline phosphatase family protein [Propionibacteriaceae bacterium]